ncbi:MAG: hypothetical protein M0025_10180 [Elusimicrobia bacterium]|nr:hypothetical protein [Elusimicrobiota bacterium]
MNGDEIKKAYAPAAIAAASMTAAPLVYGVAAEVLRRTGYEPPLAGGQASAAACALYAAAVLPLLSLKVLGAKLGARRATAAETARSLTAAAVLKGAVCEVPAVAGLLLFVLTGRHREFFALMLLSIALQVFNFPKLAEWEEKLGPDPGRLE